MKQKKYERTSITLFLVIVFFLLELLLIYNLFNIKIIEYKKYPVIITSNNEGLVIVPNKEKILWYKNTFFYINNKKIKYNIKEIKKDNNNYQINIEFPYKTKEQFITISIEKRRINMIESIINSWGGDYNN